MSAPHKFKAQLMEVYVKSIFPDAYVEMNTGTIDVALYVTLEDLHQSWNSIISFKDQKILDEDFGNITGHTSLTIPNHKDGDEYVSWIEDYKNHITFSDFVKRILEMQDFTKKVSKDICKASYEGSSYGFSIRLGNKTIILHYNPSTDFKITYHPSYKGFSPTLNPDLGNEGMIIATHLEYMCDPDDVIEKIRLMVKRILAFDSQYKSLVKVKFAELELGLGVLEQEHIIE